LRASRQSKRLTVPETINFDMQSNGALELVSTSQRVFRSSIDKEAGEGVFSSSKLCSLYDKVLEVLCCNAAAFNCSMNYRFVYLCQLLGALHHFQPLNPG